MFEPVVTAVTPYQKITLATKMQKILPRPAGDGSIRSVVSRVGPRRGGLPPPAPTMSGCGAHFVGRPEVPGWTQTASGLTPPA